MSFLETLLGNKYKFMAAAFCIALFWIGFMAYQEYSGIQSSCSRAGGTVIYDPNQNRIYCDKPYEPKYWLEEFLQDLFRG